MEVELSTKKALEVEEIEIETKTRYTSLDEILKEVGIGKYHFLLALA
jgi:hypothetical protein